MFCLKGECVGKGENDPFVRSLHEIERNRKLRQFTTWCIYLISLISINYWLIKDVHLSILDNIQDVDEF